MPEADAITAEYEPPKKLNVTGFNERTTSNEIAERFKDNIVNRTFLVTGTTVGGLGHETALTIAAHKPKLLIITGRSNDKLQASVDDIEKKHPGTNVRPIILNLSSLTAVRKAAEEIKKLDVELDVIINNAAVMAIPEFTKSEDGIEQQFASNHLAHFLLTNLLLPQLLPAGADHVGKRKRVVSVSSSVYTFSNVRFDDYNFGDGKSYDKWMAYAQSKTGNILFALELSRKLAQKGLESFSLHPGGIRTNLQRHVPGEELEPLWNLYESQGFHTKSVQEGAATSLAAALDPRLSAYNGRYMEDGEVCIPCREYVQDPEFAKKLWELSEELVGQKFEY